MGKKKRQNQNSNTSVNHTDSESESSKESTQGAEANKTICSHITKSVDIANIRKLGKTNKDKNLHLICSLCKKKDSNSGPIQNGYVCLRCASYNCGPDKADHRTEHYKTPHSDSHFLTYQINTNTIWCFKCEREVPIDSNRKFQSCADWIKKQYNDRLPYSPSRVETDSTKMNGNDSVNYLNQDTSDQTMQNVYLNKQMIKPDLNLPKVKGLVNLGNTCFFNSVLQCLAQTPKLVQLLREMDVPGEKFHIELDGVTIDTVLGNFKYSELSEQLAQILEEVSGINPGGDGRAGLGNYVVNPRRLLQALTSKCRQFEGGDQHDAHELLRHLLDSVHMDDLRRYQKAILNHIGYKNKSTEKDLDEETKSFGKRLNQKVCETIAIRPDHIFKGSLVSILECTVCNHISKREEPFLDLSLPVAQEKPQPPIVRRKQNCSSPVEEEQNPEVTMSKHQLRMEKKKMRRSYKIQRGSKKEQTQGEPTIVEEDKKDSINGEQSDADVEDNEEQDPKTEIVESGYSSEKQMSARGSPVTTQTPEDYKPLAYPVFQGCEPDPDSNKPISDQDSLLAKRSESGLGSIQELTVTIPEDGNTECTSQDSVRVNASNGSPDVSSDSQHGNFKTVDLSSSDYKVPPSSDSQIDRTKMIYEWNCTEVPSVQSQEDSSSVSLSVSPQYGSQSSQDNINNLSPKTSPKESPMSICTSLPENVCMILNSPVKSQNSQRDDNSESEERPESRMDCRQNRNSPVELCEVAELDSSLLKLSLEGITCVGNAEDTDGVEESHRSQSPCKPPESVINADNCNGFVLVGGVTASKSPIPPPLPLFTSSYSFTHPEPAVPKYNSTKHKMEEGEYSLQSCLSQFTIIEMLVGGNKVGCEACTERVNKGNKQGKTVYTNSNKQLLISKLPPIMIFHLKRFQLQKCSFRKISRHVEFPLVLDVSPFCYLHEAKPILYSLYGVVEHSGTLHGGHYVAYVKVRSHTERSPGVPPPGKWYYISDSRVSDIDESSVLNTQAYLLFYERIL